MRESANVVTRANVDGSGIPFQDISTGGAHALAISNEDYNRIEGALLTTPKAP